ncbi:MAG: Rid family hydrolase [Armatimonadota bacterium]|nr:Rid family hydrolase [Armatimonadota bacterium]MDR7486805.1 Rid family hydrolase [Armatimonadota bacterium]MDR7533856.1 Rid family hydrolase [Armatimonadota bacterium]MDR7535104.1 Rid family hydrolase [Armatimonadota bacterium]
MSPPAIPVFPPHPLRGKVTMPYAPAVVVPPGAALVLISGCHASSVYHQHPHVPEEHALPSSMREQARRAFENIRLSLDALGLTWRHVVKVTRYLTDIHEQDELNATQREFLGDHQVASTTVQISALVVPEARVEIEVLAAAPPDVLDRIGH